MLGHFKDSIHWAKALDKFGSGKFEAAQSELLRVRGPRRDYSEYLALLATTHIILLNDQVARDMLIKAMNGSQPRKPEYKDYIDLYCNYYISVVDGDEGSKTKYLEEALRSPAPSIIKQWLPLS